MEGYGVITISGKGFVWSGGGSVSGTCGAIRGDTPICNRNGATAGGFLTGATIIGFSTTVIDMVTISLSNNAVRTVEAPFTSCAV